MTTLEAEVHIPGDRTDVFEQVSTARGLQGWFAARSDADIAHRRYAFWGRNTPGVPARADVAGRLAEALAPTRLAFDWMLRGAVTRVTYELTAARGGTLLHVTHAGIPPRKSGEGSMTDFWYAALEALRLRVWTRRPQAKADHARRTGGGIRVALTVAASPGAVWPILTEADQMNRYFGQGASIDARVGGAISFGWKDGGPRTITAIEPPRRLTYTWTYRDEPDTVVSWRLGGGGRTRLEVRHTGFPPQRELCEYQVGWFTFLAVIKGMVELGDRWEMVRVSGAERGAV